METSVSNQLKFKDIICAFKHLLDIVNGNIKKARKPTTSRRPHHTSCRGNQSHKSLTINTFSPRNFTILAPQMCHLTDSIPYSSQEGRLLTDITSDGHTSFHTMLQMITRHGCKSLLVQVDPGAEVNTMPLSKYKKLFPGHFTKPGNLRKKALQPIKHMWTAHNMGPQKFLGYFMMDIQHKTLPDILQFRFFVFNKSTLTKIL